MAYDGEERRSGEERRAPERRACGKACFGSMGAARSAVRRMQRQRQERSNEGRLNIYVCTTCRAYHIGHNGELE
jgi:hypothetical protein